VNAGESEHGIIAASDLKYGGLFGGELMEMKGNVWGWAAEQWSDGGEEGQVSHDRDVFSAGWLGCSPEDFDRLPVATEKRDGI